MASTQAGGTAAQAPLEIGMLLYPGLTLLDLIGPQAVLGWHGRTHLVSKTPDPVKADSGIAIMPTRPLPIARQTSTSFSCRAALARQRRWVTTRPSVSWPTRARGQGT